MRDGFVWGVATSAYQIEGARHADGKGESIWDRFSDAGRLADPGDIACDHYRRYDEDVALMAELGVDAYRFSIAWTRVLPDGSGAVNQPGLDFYRRLVDLLLEHGITPFVTLYHWDLPQPLEEAGGWPDRDTVEAYLHYVDVTTRALGDRVRHWITHNEPWVAAHLGYLEGRFAPGRTDWSDALAAGHHLLLSHGRAVPVIRANAPGSTVGIALDCRHSYPASDDPADVAANRHFDGFRNRWFFDPVFGKGYPTDMVDAYRGRGRLGDDMIRDGDLDAIAAPIDFLGLNFYTSIPIRVGAEESEDTEVAPGPEPPAGYTEMGWPIKPDALTDFLVRIQRDYSPPAVMITENGASFSEGPSADGRVHDLRRIDYLAEHVEATRKAIDSGVNVTGYFVWSLLDNLEWVAGFDQRFGLVWVDHSTGRRVPKDSYHWYRALLMQQQQAGE